MTNRGPVTCPSQGAWRELWLSAGPFTGGQQQNDTLWIWAMCSKLIMVLTLLFTCLHRPVGLVSITGLCCKYLKGIIKAFKSRCCKCTLISPVLSPFPQKAEMEVGHYWHGKANIPPGYEGGKTLLLTDWSGCHEGHHYTRNTCYLFHFQLPAVRMNILRA